MQVNSNSIGEEFFQNRGVFSDESMRQMGKWRLPLFWAITASGRDELRLDEVLEVSVAHRNGFIDDGDVGSEATVTGPLRDALFGVGF
ncbi:hypothetical protein F0562_024064 [Nyssa sinensis]|uniref:Uncharacterized protein n=1 Tax=Nyssa sinensis TaxID=561372 RepID=A0A5J5BP10_9ASTE|nr:hypothetical protein F0562_024064 [Nyssa sinensis]